MKDKEKCKDWHSRGHYTAIQQWSEDGFNIIISDYSDPVSFSASEPLDRKDIENLFEWCKQVLNDN